MDKTAQELPADHEPDEVELLIRSGSDAQIKDFLMLVGHPADLAELLEEIDAELWPKVLNNLPAEVAAELVIELDESVREEVFDELKPRQIAELASELESDDATDVIAELDPAEVVEVLEELEKVDAEDAAEVRELLKYPDDSAGGIMQTELVSVPASATVDDAITEIREALEEETEDINSIYVVDDQGVYLGDIALSRLVVSRRGTQIGSIMDNKVADVRPEVDQEDVLKLFRKYDLVSLAVIDSQGLLIGRIQHDDIVDVAAEEADEDALRMAGTDAEELVYGNRILRIAGVRLPWLITNLLGTMVAGYLLYQFKVVITDAIALLAFVPVIIGMGGNVGSQSSTIVTRGFATGRIEMDDIGKTLLKEIAVGLLLSLACATVVGLAATTSIWEGSLAIGVVVGISMVLAMTLAAALGTLAPALFKRFNIDPAIAAGPFVTTANDITGIIIYMGCALALLDLLS